MALGLYGLERRRTFASDGFRDLKLLPPSFPLVWFLKSQINGCSFFPVTGITNAGQNGCPIEEERKSRRY